MFLSERLRTGIGGAIDHKRAAVVSTSPTVYGFQSVPDRGAVRTGLATPRTLRSSASGGDALDANVNNLSHRIRGPSFGDLCSKEEGSPCHVGSGKVRSTAAPARCVCLSAEGEARRSRGDQREPPGYAPRTERIRIQNANGQTPPPPTPRWDNDGFRRSRWRGGTLGGFVSLCHDVHTLCTVPACPHGRTGCERT